MNIEIINTFIKNFLINLIIFYIYYKSTNTEELKERRIVIVLTFFSIFLAIIYIILKSYMNSIYIFVLQYVLELYILQSIIKNTKNILSIQLLFSISFSYLMLLVSFIMESPIIFLFSIQNNTINIIFIYIINIILVVYFFKIKRFKNGFNFLKKQNEFIDLIVFNISSIIIFIYAIPGLKMSDSVNDMGRELFIPFAILCVVMFIITQKTLVLFYKQKQLERAVKEYEEEIKEKDKIIERKTEENFRYNKLNHEFYGRLKSLEITVEDLIKENKFNSEISEELIVDINNLTKEYSNKQKESKSLDKLAKTEILEIDNMFYYMQTEAVKKNIDFNLQITGNIYYMINNIIPKNLLVTLIGDHLKDAIIAIDSSNNTYKNILVVLGRNNDIYELCIYDSGIEFEIDTLLNLGLKPVTTHSDTGGTGIGFITTFETLNKTKASLIIEEKHPMIDTDYTKVVRIRFDNKNQYRIKSYRAEEIRKKVKDDRIIIENFINN